MEEKGFIKIKIDGNIGQRRFSREDVDIAEIREMLSDVETFLYPNRNDKTSRPHISYRIEEGSAIHQFNLPLTFVLFFNSLTSEIANRKSIEFLEPKRAEIIEKWQKMAKERSLELTLSNSSNTTQSLTINRETNYYLAVTEWVETELYLYGEIFDEGGKSTPNIHIETKEYGIQKIESTKEQLASDDNKLYKVYGVRVWGKQNIITGAIKDLKFIEFINYNPKYDSQELDILIAKASKNWAVVPNTDEWLKQIRGN
jgi:DNA-binding transcriptional MerR regulator